MCCSQCWPCEHSLCEVRQIPIDSYDVTAVVIQTGATRIVVVAIYDTNMGGTTQESNDRLLRKLGAVQEEIVRVRREEGPDIPILLCTDLNRHNAIWSGEHPIAARKFAWPVHMKLSVSVSSCRGADGAPAPCLRQYTWSLMLGSSALLCPLTLWACPVLQV